MFLVSLGMSNFLYFTWKFKDLSSEIRVKRRKNIFVGGLLLGLAIILTSCLFESDETGVGSWLSDHGMPSSYGVQVLSVENVKVESASAFLDTRPKNADSRAVLGRTANLSHDLFFDFAFSVDSNFSRRINAADSVEAFLKLNWLKNFYTAKKFPSDSLPLEEELSVNVSWKVRPSTRKYLDSLAKVPDSVWFSEIAEWDSPDSAATISTIKLDRKDTVIRIDFPEAMIDSLKKLSGFARLQFKLSAPDAKRVYHVQGAATDRYPEICMTYPDAQDSLNIQPYRMANAVVSFEDCPECAVLHGGVYDSLVVEIPSEPIMKALSDFYGDEFPYSDGNGMDVRQTVVMAQVTMSRDDANGESELGLPIQVVVGSFIDSANTVVRRMENYQLDKTTILEKGHQNLVFHDGDSLSLQVTYGMKELLNKASDGRNLKFMMRLGYPFLQEMDTTYATHVTKDGDTSYVFLSHFDYARYDFSSSLEKPVSLKLWLASKRGN